MKLSDVLKNYREEHKISQRELARRCKLSHSSINLIEKGENPQTGKAMSQDMETYKKIADGMGITVQNLFETLGDDAAVQITPIKVTLAGKAKKPNGTISTPNLRIGKGSTMYGLLTSDVVVPRGTIIQAGKVHHDPVGTGKIFVVDKDPETINMLRIWGKTKPEKKKDLVRIMKVITETEE